MLWLSMAQALVALFRLRVYRILQVAKIYTWKTGGERKIRTKIRTKTLELSSFEGGKFTQVKGKKLEKDCIPSTLTLLGLSCCTPLGFGLRETWLKHGPSLTNWVTLLFCASVSSTNLIWLLGGLCEFISPQMFTQTRKQKSNSLRS